MIEALPYVGCVATSTDTLVPMGELSALLESFDSRRMTVPSPVPMWEWGWTDSAEVRNCVAANAYQSVGVKVGWYRSQEARQCLSKGRMLAVHS